MHGTLDHFQWTEARIADLKAKIDAKLSASEAAAEFGVSRGAVIGKARRMGWAFDSPDIRNVKYRAVMPKKERPLRQKPLRVLPVRERISSAPFLGISLMKIRDNQCHRPDPENFDPRNPLYCGQPTSSGPYCPACASIMYQPMQARHREPRPRA